MTTVSLEPVTLDDADDRQGRLADALARVRSRTAAPAQLERRIALVGGTLAAAGAVLVLLAWYGASRTSRVYLQIPYLISGGLLGVVLAFAGGAAYLASWLTRLVQEERNRGDEAIAVARDTAAALARIEELLARSAVGAPTVGSDLVATPSGRLAHRPTCPTVAGRRDLRRVDGGDLAFAACRMCEPGVPEAGC